MERVTVAVVGAGHAGLAASHFLSERSLDHVVLERGEVGNSWRRERWDSLRLLTPNWQSRLPGLPYEGPDPDGYMDAGAVADLLARFAAKVDAPVRTRTTVSSVAGDDAGYRVATDSGELHARALVIASGACNLPSVPAVAGALPAEIEQLTTHAYRSPAQLAEGGVLVVGASATGVQLAAEIRDSGRPVVLSVGEHVRLPRTYRGRDVLWWMDHAGVWDQRHDEIEDLNRARSLPSPQLVGSVQRATLDLNRLTELGVEPVGKLATIRDGVALFSGGLRNVCALADLKLERLLDLFDEWALTARPDAELGPPERFAPTRVPARPRLQLDLRGGEIRTVLWATGYRADYSWLSVPVLDRKGRLRHDGGIVSESPGLYALGLPVMRRRRSSFICGIEDDAREVIDELAGWLGGLPRANGARRAELSTAVT